MARSRKKCRKPLDVMAQRNFLDGNDSYKDEYGKWLRMPIVRGLVGVFEFPSDQYYGTTSQEKISLVGYGHYKHLNYSSEIENDGLGEDTGAKATGCTCVVADHRGNVRPVIFMRENVNADPTVLKGEDLQCLLYAIKLPVLMHEMGHAEDIAKGINFDHRNKRLDVVGAEAYAHAYVCKHAKRMNYRLLLGYYLTNIEDGVESEDDSVRLSARKALESLDLAALREASSVEFGGMDGYRRYLERIGRLKDFMPRQTRK